jgi:DNA-binding LacI/PurR family transcriptional regulator
MAVTIKDIAKIAQVSPATVSLVLNNKPGVGSEARERILRIAAELSYQGPKPAAGIGSETVCFLHISRHGHTVNRDHDVFIADYIDGLGQRAKSESLNLEILSFRASPIDMIIAAARGRAAAGFIVLGTELSESDVQAFSALTVPLVFIDTYLDFMPFDFVDMNNEDSVFTIATHFASRGHRDIGMVTSSIETRNFKLREEGLVLSLARLGLEFDRSHLYAVDPTFHGAHQDMRRILREGTKLPSALFCANDIIACGCLRALREEGIKVPEDLSLVGFDDLPLSSVVDPPLTTVQVSKAQIGRMAIQLLTTRIRGSADSAPVKVLIGGRLVERQSVRDISGIRASGGSA